MTQKQQGNSMARVLARGSTYTVEAAGLDEIERMLNGVRKNLKNVSSVLLAWREFAGLAIASNVATGTRTSSRRPGITGAMKRLAASTTRLRMRGIHRCGDPGGSVPGARVMYATGDYAASWAYPAHKDRQDKEISADATSSRGAEYHLINSSVKTVHETGQKNKSRIFFGKVVPPRPVSNIFTKKVMLRHMVPLFMAHVFRNTGIRQGP